jgi:hypothetical protein
MTAVEREQNQYLSRDLDKNSPTNHRHHDQETTSPLNERKRDDNNQDDDYNQIPSSRKSRIESSSNYQENSLDSPRQHQQQRQSSANINSTSHLNNNNNNKNGSNINVNHNENSHFMKYQNEPTDVSHHQRNLSLEYGKTIKLLRNGDEFYRGQKLVINSRKYRYFDVLLDDISDSMNARFGAVRRIHTPTHGHPIKSLDQIEDGKTYVAAGTGRFVKLNYMDISEGKRLTKLPSIPRQRQITTITSSVPLYEQSLNVHI